MIPAWLSFRWDAPKAPCGMFLRKGSKLYIPNYNSPILPPLICNVIRERWLLPFTFSEGAAFSVKYTRILLYKVCMFRSSVAQQRRLALGGLRESILQ